MPHLGSDVAAYVDGQLPAAAMRDVDLHLRDCDSCERAVRQQRLLKSRMSTVAAPAVSSDLMASLAGLAAAPPPEDRWWRRVRRGTPFRAGLVLAGASLSVAAVAYVVGGVGGGIGDRIAPPFAEYSAAFFGATSTSAATTVSDAGVAQLDEEGWPCQPRLAGDLERTNASYTRSDDTIALTYSNGTTRMKLYEQSGWLDTDSVAGFTRRTWGEASVWVRESDDEPTVVTWDEDGVVYTIVTDADPGRIQKAVAELPTNNGSVDPINRVGDGIGRMTAWVSAA